VECNCYVHRLVASDRFALRRGAHELSCPDFRESRDPVDRVQDAITRDLYLIIDKEGQQICPYCGYEIMYNGPDDFDPVSVDELDESYHDDCYADKFGGEED
jgi:hypothetical protein